MIDLQAGRAIRACRPDSTGVADDDDTLVVPVDTMRGFFDPIISDIIALIQQAKTAVLKAHPGRKIIMLLVGGFSESK